MDENYVKWEVNGGKDLQLSAFKLTNRQMLWLNLAHVGSEKFPVKSGRGFHNFLIENMHVLYKRHRRFRDAFKCGDLSDSEKGLLDTVYEVLERVGISRNFVELLGTSKEAVEQLLAIYVANMKFDDIYSNKTDY